MRRGRVAATGRTAPLLIAFATASSWPAPAAAQAVRLPMRPELAAPVAEALAASPDQRIRLVQLIEAWPATHEAELSDLVERKMIILFRGDGSGGAGTAADRLRAAEALAARQRARALALEQRFRREAAAILTPDQRPRLDRVMRAWERSQRGWRHRYVPPGHGDPIAATERVVRAEATAADGGLPPDAAFVPRPARGARPACRLARGDGARLPRPRRPGPCRPAGGPAGGGRRDRPDAGDAGAGAGG